MKLILVSGSNDSGKSLFAEELISRCDGPRYYIATMKPQTAENHQRIEKHRRQREHLQCETLELPYEIANTPLEANGVVLLEDVSNLLANVLFEKKGNASSVLEDILRLKEQCQLLVAVTISSYREKDYDGETAAYIRELNHINQQLFQAADIAYEMKNHQAVCAKGENHAHS